MASSSKIKVAYVVTPITFGGIERVNLNFLTNVDLVRFSITPILFLRPWESENFFQSEIKKLGFEYFTIPVARSKNSGVFRIVRCFYELLKLIHGNSYDLIHTHGYLADILGVLVSKVCKIPIISTCHGFIKADTKLSMYNDLDLFALRFFDRLISVSDPLKLDLARKGIRKDKVTVIVNTPGMRQCTDSVSLKREQLRHDLNVLPNDHLIGYVGRLSEEKGVVHLLESFKLLNDFPHSFKLVFIGEGPQESMLKSISEKYELTSRVIFAGFQNNVHDWFPAIDLFVLPSLTEGTPMVLLEAMSFGIPCIASAVGGVPQIIESGVDGVLIVPAKPQEISQAIHDLSNNPEKVICMSKMAKNKIMRNYNVNEWTKKIENEYLHIMGNY